MLKDSDGLRDLPARNKKNNDTKVQANTIKQQDLKGIEEQIAQRNKVIKKQEE